MYHTNTPIDYLCLGGFFIVLIILAAAFLKVGSSGPKGIDVTPDDEGSSYGFLVLGLFGIPAIICGAVIALLGG